jgi:hypothetical protein
VASGDAAERAVVLVMGDVPRGMMV